MLSSFGDEREKSASASFSQSGGGLGTTSHPPPPPPADLNFFPLQRLAAANCPADSAHTMFAARRQAVARPLRQLVQSQRRHASAHHHAEPVSEGFGRSFYLVLALFPATYLLYVSSRPRGPNEPHAWTKALESYSDWKAEWTRRNANHTKLVEQAGRDRNLFLNTPMPNHIELGMPELIGTSSPINVPAGHQSDIQQVIAHYREKQFKEEAEKREKQRQAKLGEAP